MEMGLDSLATTQLVKQLSDDLDVKLSSTLLFNYPTVSALASYTTGIVSGNVDATHDGRADLVNHIFDGTQRPIAVVGMSCRLPGGCEGPAMFWDALAAGQCMVSKVPFNRWDVDAVTATKLSWSMEAKSRMHWGGFVEELELFEPSFFRVSPLEAGAMDPQQRLLLEYSWLAFQDAGHTKETLQDRNAGVFVGIASSDAAEIALKTPLSADNVYFANATDHGDDSPLSRSPLSLCDD